MKHNLILTASLLGGIVLLAGCVKEKSNDDIYRPAGSEIVFGAATEYVNGDGTRTEYSGSDVNSGAATYERINWVSSDDMKIYYAIDGTNAQNAVYNVDGAGNADGKDSRVGISASTSTKLTWGSASNNHRFRAVYPASASFDGTNVGGSIPAAQAVTLNNAQSNSTQRRYLPDMSHAYMVSQLTVPANSTTSRVDLPFTPAMTAFQFRFKVPSTYENTLISSIVLSTEAVNGHTTPLAGNFSFAITGEVANVGADWTKTEAASNLTSTSNSITLTFGGNVDLKKTDYLDFTILALPIPITGLSVTVNYVGGDHKTLKLKKSGSWVSFDACKKYVITNDNVPGGEIWDYYIDPIPNRIAYGHNAITATNVFDYDVYSYKVKRGTTTKVPVSWHMEYSTDKGSSWSETWPATTEYSMLTTVTGAGSNGATYQSGNSTLPNASTGETTGEAEDATRAALATATPRGTESNPFDLSIHPCYGNKDATYSQTTANCYIVSAPGYYKFPLVYGNARKNGQDNVVAYAPESVLGLYNSYKSEAHVLYLTTFKNALNQDITSPYILSDLSSASGLNAAVIWQDVPEGSEIIKYDAVGIEGSGTNAYITFYISADDIRQGNIVIALRGNAGDLTGNDNILWSWHIWVTEKDILNPMGANGSPLPTAVVSHYPSGSTTTMARFNLGWTDKTNASSTKWPDRRLDIKIVQDDPNGTSCEFYFRQVGDSKHVDSNIGSNLFYQWGRKDPMIPAASNDSNKSMSTGTYMDGSIERHYVLELSDHKSPNLSSIQANTMDYGTPIRNPHIMYKNTVTTGWVGGPSNITHSNGTPRSDYDRTHSSIPYNLWSAYARTQAGKEALGGKEKTVYDPCPPGFTVPDLYAFCGFAGSCIYSWGSMPSNLPYHKNGVEVNEGVNYYISGTSGATIYLPYTGARGYQSGEIYDVKKTGYYWTDCPDISTYNRGNDKSGERMSKMIYFNRYTYDGETPTGDGPISPQADLYKGAAYSIRPVLE